MKENKTTQYRIQIGNDLLAYLHPESGEKYSKMAAFRHLIELATGDKKEFPAIAKPLPEGQVALTVSGLAKHWNWHRTTVRSKSLGVAVISSSLSLVLYRTMGIPKHPCCRKRICS